MRVEADPATYDRALALAKRHKHHLFDTLYHALALSTPGALLVTADSAYWRKTPGLISDPILVSGGSKSREAVQA